MQKVHVGGGFLAVYVTMTMSSREHSTRQFSHMMYVCCAAIALSFPVTFHAVGCAEDPCWEVFPACPYHQELFIL